MGARKRQANEGVEAVGRQMKSWEAQGCQCFYILKEVWVM